MAIRVLIADDQAMVRAGLRMLLGAADGIEVVGEAQDGREAVERAADCRPDVVVMDVQMPRLDGVAATREILAVPVPPRVLVITTFDVDDYVFEALRAGASGFMLKNAPPEDLVAAVRTLAAGDGLIAPAVTRRVIAEFARRSPAAALAPSAALQELTERELEVFGLVARGLSNAEIAAELVVSNGTVKTHVARILGKLGLRDRVQAVVLAYESGSIRPTTDLGSESRTRS